MGTNSKIGGARYFSNLAHFETTTTIGTTVVAKTIEIEPIQGHAIVIDAIKVCYRGLAALDADAEIFGMVSLDENVAAVDTDDEDTIYSFALSKAFTTSGIAQAFVTDGIHFDRGIPTTSRALRLLMQSDNNSLGTHFFDCQVEYHYEPISKAMYEVRGV